MKKIITLLALAFCINTNAQYSTGVTFIGNNYHYDTLHLDASGYVRNTNGCEVMFAGFNTASISTGGADGVDSMHTANLKDSMQTNIIRMEINSRWWVNNVYVPVPSNPPLDSVFYKQWLQINVAKIKQLGFYVLIDFFTNFGEKPWNTIGYGTQNLGELDYENNSSPWYHDTTVLQQSNYYPLQAIHDLAKLYGNDPAVLFDLWNEPASYIWSPSVPNSAPEKNFLPRMNQRIDTLRKYAPKSIAVVYCERVDSMMADSSRFPLYSQNNILIDFHCYDDTTPRHCPSRWLPPYFWTTGNWLRAHGKGLISCEWGETNNQPLDSVYTFYFSHFCDNNHIGSLIYHETDHKYVGKIYDSIFNYGTACNVTLINSANNNATVSVFPNPTTNSLQVTFSGNILPATCQMILVTDVLGNVLIHNSAFITHNLTLDVSSLTPGVYFVRVGTATQKFIKE